MNLQTISLVSWTGGTIMIVIFAIVCVALISAILLLVNSDQKNKK